MDTVKEHISVPEDEAEGYSEHMTKTYWDGIYEKSTLENNSDFAIFA